MAASERDSSAHLIDRLVGDAQFRELFQRDPVAALREAGVDGSANELARTAGKAIETLEVRESRSSLAGVMMAAALEGLVVSGLASNGVAEAADLPRSHGAASSAPPSRAAWPELANGGAHHGVAS